MSTPIGGLHTHHSLARPVKVVLRWDVKQFSWCSGYHICLTHRRSPVRSRAKTIFSTPIFVNMENIVLGQNLIIRFVCITPALYVEKNCRSKEGLSWMTKYQFSPFCKNSPCPFHLRNESIYFSLWVLVPLSLEKKIERKCWGGRW